MQPPVDRRTIWRRYRREHPVASRGVIAGVGALMGWTLVFRVTLANTAVNLSAGAVLGACLLLALFEWRTR